MPAEFLVSPWSGVFWLLALLVSLSWHEFAHALTAYSLGDQTPKSDGRVTLLPFSHIDPLGFVLFLFFGFGWAKPVKFDPGSLRYRTFGSTLVALAGPVANVVLLFLVIALMKLATGFGLVVSLNIQVLFLSFVLINSILVIVNVIPLPPFDGSKLLLDVLTKLHLDGINNFLVKNGPYILFGLLFLDGTVGPGLVTRALSALVSLATSIAF